MQFRKLSHALGAEVVDFRITDDCGPEAIEEIKQGFARHQILLFRDQDISFDTHIGFSRKFGPLEDHEGVPEYRHPDYPELVVVTNEGKQRSQVFGQQWHSDHSMRLHPSMASLLHAHVIPEVGGDTMFANMYAAYDSLSDGMKQLLEPLRAVHSVLGARHLRGLDQETRARKAKNNPPVIHPVVRRHAVTGRPALYVNEMLTTRFDGMTEDESRPLLEYLFAHSTRPEFVYRHKWRKHDIVMWDNRCTMHLALLDYDHSQLRRLFRTTLQEDVYQGELAAQA